MKRKSENKITYCLNSNEIKKALRAYVSDHKTECGKYGFTSETSSVKMTLNKDQEPVTAEVSEMFEVDEEG